MVLVNNYPLVLPLSMLEAKAFTLILSLHSTWHSYSSYRVCFFPRWHFHGAWMSLSEMIVYLVSPHIVEYLRPCPSMDVQSKPQLKRKVVAL